MRAWPRWLKRLSAIVGKQSAWHGGTTRYLLTSEVYRYRRHLETFERMASDLVTAHVDRCHFQLCGNVQEAGSEHAGTDPPDGYRQGGAGGRGWERSRPHTACLFRPAEPTVIIHGHGIPFLRVHDPEHSGTGPTASYSRNLKASRERGRAAIAWRAGTSARMTPA